MPCAFKKLLPNIPATSDSAPADLRFVRLSLEKGTFRNALLRHCGSWGSSHVRPLLATGSQQFSPTFGQTSS